MGFLTGRAGLPSVIALLVILVEFFGALFLIAGFATRLATICILGNFVGVIVTSNLNNGFFMNWYAQANKGEGLEYFILLFGLAIISVVAGGGRANADAPITKGLLVRQRRSKTAIA